MINLVQVIIVWWQSKIYIRGDSNNFKFKVYGRHCSDKFVEEYT